MVYMLWHEFGVGVASCLHYIFVLLIVSVYTVLLHVIQVSFIHRLSRQCRLLYEFLAVLFGKAGLHRGRC